MVPTSSCAGNRHLTAAVLASGNATADALVFGDMQQLC
jgi:hypothetical protein